MRDFNSEHNSLLSWIDPNSEEQVSWISSYLSKKGRADLLDGFAFAVGGWAGWVDSLRGHPGDENFRKLIRGMRGAWYQKKYRESNGRQVSFQLPERVARELDRIARERGCSKTQALRQVISDAAKSHQRVKKQSKEKIKQLENNLKRLQEKKGDAEFVRDRAIDALLSKLADQIVNDCLEKETSPEDDVENGVGSASDRFAGILREKIAELERLVPEVGQIRPQGKTIQNFFDDHL